MKETKSNNDPLTHVRGTWKYCGDIPPISHYSVAMCDYPILYVNN